MEGKVRQSQLTLEEVAARRRFSDGPAWRYQLAESLAGDPRRPPANLADQHVLAALAYLRLDDVEERRRLFPHVATADALHADAALLDKLKILVVGDCPRAEIAAQLGLDVQTVATWEFLFYDVRPALAALSWVAREVIRPEELRGNASLAAKLKFASAGPIAARAFIEAESRISLKRGVRLLDQKILLMVKSEEALQLPLTSERASLFFLKTHADLMSLEKRIRLAEKRLEFLNKDALRKQKLADLRLESAARRQEENAAKAGAGSFSGCQCA